MAENQKSKGSGGSSNSGGGRGSSKGNSNDSNSSGKSSEKQQASADRIQKLAAYHQAAGVLPTLEAGAREANATVNFIRPA